MKSLNGANLTPLFHSEITSSYMLYDIFSTHTEAARQFIAKTFHIAPENILVHRERSYPRKGSIDVFLEFTLEGRKSALLIEVKVHDYLSATGDQIETYYNAVVDDGMYENVYFVYLTQFNDSAPFTEIAAPHTLHEARKGRVLIGPRFAHVSWPEMHMFLSQYAAAFTDEQRLIVDLQRAWIEAQSRSDLENNRIDIGTRALEEYFTDIHTDIRELLPFGREVNENRRQIWRVEVTELTGDQMNILLDVIRRFTASRAVNRIKQFRTEDATLQAAQEYLAELARGADEWLTLSFYARLFDLMERSSYVKFNGKGGRGFSIKLEIKGKGEISLCTLYRNRIIDFSMKR